MTTTRYSGTPLAKKLGIKILKDTKTRKDVIHYFAVSVSQLSKDIKQLKGEMETNGAIWISWPKKSAHVKTDLGENVIRDIALENGLVDVKVCAIDEVWSGLKLVVRLKDRK